MDRYESTMRWARRKYGKPLGQGLWRRVFAESDDYVIKVPFGEWGEYCNDNEAIESNGEIQDGTLAKCESFNHPRTGIVLLRMERIIRFPTMDDKLPTWTDWIDCQQVGFTKDNRLVAYDWVYPPQDAQHCARIPGKRRKMGT